jgi:hypothetical protein
VFLAELIQREEVLKDRIEKNRKYFDELLDFMQS